MGIELDHRTVNRYADRALHRQLADAVRAGIVDGRLQPGEALPSETDIAEAVGISRTAVRDAWDVLAGEGRIVRRSGQASRVAAPPQVRHMATSRYADELAILAAGGEHPHSSAFTTDHGIDWDAYDIDANYEQAAATPEEAERLELAGGAPVLRRRMVKYVRGQVEQIQTSVMPLDIVGGTAVTDPGRQPWPGGTIAELWSVGKRVERVREEATARMPTDGERAELQMETTGPVRQVVRIFYADGRPVEFSEVIGEAARVVLVFETDLT